VARCIGPLRTAARHVIDGSRALHFPHRHVSFFLVALGANRPSLVKKARLQGAVLSDHREKLLALLQAHGARLHALLTRLTLHPDAAEDLLQDLFLKLDRSKAFQRAADPVAYARRAAIHLAFDWHRQRQNTPPCESLPGETAGNAPPPLSLLVQREELGQVVDALAALPALSRDCLVLHYLEYEPYEAVAQQIGKTPHQVRALCHKGIIRLRSLLGPPRAPSRKEASHDDT
jgi:RNA polymerase sigma-70 factor (ECF subfamily)